VVKVKVCGITNLEDALASVFSGASAIGFVFYKKSPRYISPEQARNIALIIPKAVKKVGVFVNASENRIKQIAGFCRLDILQFHGDESAEFCARFKGFKVVKAFGVDKQIDLDKIRKYHKIYGVLFDRFDQSRFGGTGKKFNWKILAPADKIKLSGLKRPVFLSGGLTLQNVASAVKLTKVDWVDVSSSVESRPGKKDHRKIQQFVRKAKGLKINKK